MPGKPKPLGVTIIKYATLLSFFGLGYFGFMCVAFLGMGTGQGRFPPDPATVNLATFFLVNPTYYFLVLLVLSIKPRKTIWYSLNIFWILLSSFITVFFANYSLYGRGSYSPRINRGFPYTHSLHFSMSDFFPDNKRKRALLFGKSKMEYGIT
jgi:hypothetical protein